MDFFDWSKIFRSSGLEAIQNTQKAFQKFDYTHKSYFSQMNKFAETIKSPAIQAILGKPEILSGGLQFDKTLSAIEKVGVSNQFYSQIPAFQNQLPEIQALFRPFNAVSPIVENNSIVNHAFSNAGIFDAISKISQNVTAMQALTRINELLPLVENIDYDITFSDTDTILVDNIQITKSDINELSQEFIDIAPDNSDIFIRTNKLKSKAGKCFLSLLWFVLYNLFLSPVLEDAFSIAREHLGINKLLEIVNIKNWVDGLPDTSNEVTINASEEINE